MIYAVTINSHEELLNGFESTKVLNDPLNANLHRDKYQFVTQPGECITETIGGNWGKIYYHNWNEELRDKLWNPYDPINAEVEVYCQPQDHPDKSRLIYHSGEILYNRPVLFHDRKQYRGKNEVVSLPTELRAKRYQFAHCVEDHYLSCVERPSTQYKIGAFKRVVTTLKSANWTQDNLIIHSRSELSDPAISYDWEKLFNDVVNGAGCYWFGVEPFNFMMDIDFYHVDQTQWKNMTIKEVVDIVSGVCDHWLITETFMKDGSPVNWSTDSRLRYRDASYNIFTDKMVTTNEAVYLEMELMNRFADYMGIKWRGSPIGNICAYWQPFVFRRTPLSCQKWWSHEPDSPEKKSIPRLDYSNLKDVSPFGIFKFSYPNPD